MNKLTAVLERQKNSHNKQTLGVLRVYRGEKLIFECKTLERPWLDNKIGQSCVPTGTYPVKHRYSPKFKMIVPWLQDTEPRKWILIHYGNYVTDIEGCILVGKDHIDINGDGLLDVTASRKTLAELKEALKKEIDGVDKLPELERYEDFTLTIK